MIEKRFNELYTRAQDRYYNTFSDFLNMEEQSILASTNLPCKVYGGYSSAERVIAGFGEEIEEKDFPIKYLAISPVAQKFSDQLSHRDFLGALMNLGIKREKLGDIIVANNCGYLICLEQIADYIKGNLTKIKHTTVTVDVLENLPDNIVKPMESQEVIVSSLRLDVLVSGIYKMSRKEASRLFETGKIFVNSKETTSTSYQVKEGDVVSVRGSGRFVFVEVLRSTKKGRIVIEIQK